MSLKYQAPAFFMTFGVVFGVLAVIWAFYGSKLCYKEAKWEKERAVERKKKRLVVEMEANTFDWKSDWKSDDTQIENAACDELYEAVERARVERNTKTNSRKSPTGKGGKTARNFLRRGAYDGNSSRQNSEGESYYDEGDYDARWIWNERNQCWQWNENEVWRAEDCVEEVDGVAVKKNSAFWQYCVDSVNMVRNPLKKMFPNVFWDDADLVVYPEGNQNGANLKKGKKSASFNDAQLEEVKLLESFGRFSGSFAQAFRFFKFNNTSSLELSSSPANRGPGPPLPVIREDCSNSPKNSEKRDCDVVIDEKEKPSGQWRCRLCLYAKNGVEDVHCKACRRCRGWYKNITEREEQELVKRVKSRVDTEVSFWHSLEDKMNVLKKERKEFSDGYYSDSCDSIVSKSSGWSWESSKKEDHFLHRGYTVGAIHGGDKRKRKKNLERRWAREEREQARRQKLK